MSKKLLLILFICCPKLLCAQSYEKEYVALFAWEVKQIDEFIERFDNNDQTLIKQYQQKHNTSPLTREKLIKSLFNAERTDWNYADITNFIKQVNDTINPVHIDFYDNNWFANVTCAVVWNNKPENVILKLKIQKQPNGSSKWVIADIDARFLGKNSSGANAKTDQPILPRATDSNATLNPMSHATDFLNIDMVTKDVKNISNYIATSNSYSNDMCLFINECLNNRIKILRSVTVTYRFLQIKGWDMEVQQYNRQTKNSGWLISKLIKLPS